MTMMKLALHLSLLTLALQAQNALAFGLSSNPSSNGTRSRHEFLKQISTGIISAATVIATTTTTPSTANADVIRNPKCTYGEGEGCSSLAEDNPLILKLQQQSLERKAATQQENLSAFQMKNYPDFFTSLNPPKYMVKRSDGSGQFDLYDDVELTELKKQGRIKMEQPMAMGGKVVDVTQKPMMVLVDK